MGKKAVKKTWKRGRSTSTPVADRKQFLTMMTPAVIRDIKEAALADGRPAWEVMEEAAVEWLKRRKQRASD
jgi:hypothetical protein